MRVARTRMLIAAKKITAATMKEDVVKAIEAGKPPQKPGLMELIYEQLFKQKDKVFWLLAVTLFLILEGMFFSD